MGNLVAMVGPGRHAHHQEAYRGPHQVTVLRVSTGKGRSRPYTVFNVQKFEWAPPSADWSVPVIRTSQAVRTLTVVGDAPET